MQSRITLYQTYAHPVSGEIMVNHDNPVIRLDRRPKMKVRKKKDGYRLVSECDAEKITNAIPVRYLFVKKQSRRERKRTHRSRL